MPRSYQILALLAVTCTTQVAADDDYLRVILEAPAPSPFSVVRYEVMHRGPAVTAVHRRQLPGYDEALHGMGLLTRDEATALEALVAAVEPFALPDALAGTPGSGQLTWRVEIRRGDEAHSFRVRDPVNQPDARYWRLVRGVQRLVRERAGDLPFRNVFYAPRRLGWVDIQSVPAATVAIDGFDTRHETPLYGYELSAGEHEIRLRSRDGAHDRTYRIRVEPSGTTHLHVDLR